MKKKKYKDFETKIMGEKWEVKFVTPVIDPSNNNEACGLCHYETKTLFINSSLDYLDAVHTLFHELFHAYVRRSGIYNANLSHEMEEIIADQFALVIIENFEFDIL